MTIVKNANGPIDNFLRTAGITQELLERDLRNREPWAVNLFAADILFGQICGLEERLENIEAAMLTAD